MTVGMSRSIEGQPWKWQSIPTARIEAYSRRNMPILGGDAPKGEARGGKGLRIEEGERPETRGPPTCGDSGRGEHGEIR